jgi:hypothetical protein
MNVLTEKVGEGVCATEEKRRKREKSEESKPYMALKQEKRTPLNTTPQL